MRALGILSVAMACIPASAGAAVLTAANAPRLCTASYNGQVVVDTDALAAMVVGDAQAFSLLDGANSTGATDGAVQMRSTAAGPSEPVYSVLHLGDKPFGPGVDLDKRPDAKAAAEAIRSILLHDVGHFLLTGILKDKDAVIYRTVTVPGSPTDPADPDNRNALKLFGPGRSIIIRCEGASETPPVSPAHDTPGESPPSKGATVAIRLRGTAKAMTSRDELKDSDPATISFERNATGSKTTFGITAVAGVAVSDPNGSFIIAPYVAYDRTRITGGTGNIEKLAPGVLGAVHFGGTAAALDVAMELSYIDDIGQHARQGKLRFYLDPAFRLGDGHGILFGSNLKVAGLVLRPDVTGIIDISHVYARGTSTELATAQNYAGFGGQGSLKVRLDTQGWAKDFSLTLGGRNLFMTGDIDQRSINRWFGSFDYASSEFPNIGVGFSFTKGENDDTFQPEETYKIGLKLRY